MRGGQVAKENRKKKLSCGAYLEWLVRYSWNHFS